MARRALMATIGEITTLSIGALIEECFPSISPCVQLCLSTTFMILLPVIIGSVFMPPVVTITSVLSITRRGVTARIRRPRRVPNPSSRVMAPTVALSGAAAASEELQM